MSARRGVLIRSFLLDLRDDGCKGEKRLHQGNQSVEAVGPPQRHSVHRVVCGQQRAAHCVGTGRCR